VLDTEPGSANHLQRYTIPRVFSVQHGGKRTFNALNRGGEAEKIAKILAHAGTLRERLRGRHIEEVRAFLHAKS